MEEGFTLYYYDVLNKNPLQFEALSRPTSLSAVDS